MVPKRYEKYDDVIAFLINRVSYGLRQSLALRLNEKGIDLTAEDFTVLNLIGDSADSSQQEIAELAFKDGPTVSRCIYKLSQQNLVTSRTDAQDRRVKRISLTKKGASLRAELLEIADTNLTAIERGVSTKDLDILRNTLKKLLSNLTDLNDSTK